MRRVLRFGHLIGVVMLLGAMAFAPSSAAAASPQIWLADDPANYGSTYKVEGSGFTASGDVHVTAFNYTGTIIWQGRTSAGAATVYRCGIVCGPYPNPRKGLISIPTSVDSCYPSDGWFIAVDVSTGLTSRVDIPYCPW